MSRRSRALALALVGLALVAATAAAAQAGTFTAGKYPATVVATNQVPQILSTTLGEIKCAPNFHGVLGAASETLTLAPGYGPCELGAKEVHVDLNGCDYLLHVGETGGMNEIDGTMDIDCPVGAVIDFEVTSVPVCHLTVGEQFGLGTLTYTSAPGWGDALLHFELSELDYTLDMGCPGAGVHTDGTYGSGTVTMVGFKEPGVQTQFGVE